MKTIKGYILDDQRTLFEIVQVRENPRRAGHYPHAENVIINCDELPKLKEYETAVLLGDDKTWEVKPDYRGLSYYDKLTGVQQEIITDVGIKIDFEKYTLLHPNEQYQKFDNKLNKWISDDKAKEEADNKQKLQQLEYDLVQLDIKKIRPITAVLHNQATKDDLDKLDKLEIEILSKRAEYNKIKESLD